MKVLNPIYMARNMTALTKMTVSNISFPLPNETDVIHRMFPFVKRGIIVKK